jgi:predicted lipoprotein with Yx(FWY)xxD motif
MIERLGSIVVLVAMLAPSLAISADHPCGQNADGTVAVTSTPPGIRMKMAYTGQKAPDQHPSLLFADTDNKPLYVFDKDQPDQSTCIGECAVLWPPLLAVANAKPTGDWSLIRRTDIQALQWAYLKRPLYTYSKDNPKAPSASGPGGRHDLSPDNRASGDGIAGVWHALSVKPGDAMRMPGGFGVAQVLMAPGQVLVDTSERTLYLFTGTIAASASLSTDWIPMRAPYLARPVGSFCAVSEADGTYQWALNGHPLYRYSNDWIPGDANGENVDEHMKVALVQRYFMPSDVTIRSDEHRGGLLMTTDTHRPLYTLDIAWVDPEGGHNTRGVRSDPATGEAIGVNGCQGVCERYWKPLAAPSDALPTDYWSVYTRPDGSKQWAYQGFALYTYVSDDSGQLNGHDMYHMTVAATDREPLPPNLGTFWRAVAP